jgi:hypothetical protein
MEGKKERLGKLQREILTYLMTHTEVGHYTTEVYNYGPRRGVNRILHIEAPNVTNLARALDVTQPTLLNSVRSLLKHNYLDPQYYRPNLYWELVLTEKGAAAAVILGTTYKQLNKYADFRYKKQESIIGGGKRYGYFMRPYGIGLDDTPPFKKKHEVLKYIRRVVDPYKRNRDEIIKKALTYALKNNFFDKGDFRVLTKDEAQKLKLFIAFEYMDATGGGADVVTLKKFVNKYKLDKNFLRNYLYKQKQYIESAIQELD